MQDYIFDRIVKFIFRFATFVAIIVVMMIIVLFASGIYLALKNWG